jgi:hypothetical protein
MIPKHIKELQSRSRKLRARRVDRNTYVVESLSNPQAQHIVSIIFEDDGTIHTRCTCPWAMHRGVACAHTMAALEYTAMQKGRTLSFWLTKQDALHQRQRIFYLANNNGSEGVWITSRNAETINAQPSAKHHSAQQPPAQ